MFQGHDIAEYINKFCNYCGTNSCTRWLIAPFIGFPPPQVGRISSTVCWAFPASTLPSPGTQALETRSPEPPAGQGCREPPNLGVSHRTGSPKPIFYMASQGKTTGRPARSPLSGLFEEQMLHLPGSKLRFKPPMAR